eukprot:1819493-Alexandrium_andersonii.AAC.1
MPGPTGAPQTRSSGVCTGGTSNPECKGLNRATTQVALGSRHPPWLTGDRVQLATASRRRNLPFTLDALVGEVG